MKPWVKWSLIGFVGLAMIGQIAESLKSPEEKAADKARLAAAAEQRATVQAGQQAADKAARQAAAKQMIESLPTYSAREMAEDYEANSVAADQKYKGQMFKVSGDVTDINTNIMGTPYITMGGTNMFMQPQFAFDKDSLDQLAKVRKGMKLTLACKGRGDIAKTPMSEECQLL